MAEQNETPEVVERNTRRTMRGYVVSDKMDHCR